MTARLEVITGPMFSGKSKEMLRRLIRVGHAQGRMIVARPSIDTRVGRNIFHLLDLDEKLRNYQELVRLNVDDASQLQAAVEARSPDLIAIDEGQFLAVEFLDFIDAYLQKNKKSGKTVLIAGLDMDAWGRPFGIMPNLLAMADEVLKLTAICTQCRNRNNPAIFTQKLSSSLRQIEIGDTQNYTARCRRCFTMPGARVEAESA